MLEIDVKKLEKSVFNTLYEIDTRERQVEKDTGRTKLNYLPWATTYSEVCKNFSDVEYRFMRQKIDIRETETIKPDDQTTIVKEKEYVLEIPFFNTGCGLEVRTEVTVGGITKEMCLPVYNTSYKVMGDSPYTYSTKSGQQTIAAARYDDIYKSIMRCFAKNLSMFGVGLNMWTKEDAPENILTMNKLQAECMDLIQKRAALSDKTKEAVQKLCMEMLPEENGDPRLSEDNDVLDALKKKLRAIRKL